MKNLMSPICILTFICMLLFSCGSDIQKPIYPPVPGDANPKMDFSGTWVATQVFHNYGDESIDVSGYISEIRICVNKNYSLCKINYSDSWFSTSKWGDHPDSYFGKQDIGWCIQIRIIESNISEITVRIENLTPYLHTLCPEENEDGYYLATFRRYNGLQ